MPVGATASRVIANVLLLEFDAMIQRELAPLYYARYVDDIFLVLHDTGTFHCGRDVLEWIQERTGDIIRTKKIGLEECLAVNLSYSMRSEILFQTKKQRIFLIDNPDQRILDEALKVLNGIRERTASARRALFHRWTSDRQGETNSTWQSQIRGFCFVLSVQLQTGFDRSERQH